MNDTHTIGNAITITDKDNKLIGRGNIKRITTHGLHIESLPKSDKTLKEDSSAVGFSEWFSFSYFRFI